MTKRFIKSAPCKSRAHCQTCRDREGGRQWRLAISEHYQLPGGEVDFECPYGIAWEDAKPPPAPANHPAKPERCLRCGGELRGGCKKRCRQCGWERGCGE